jgi:ubiquinone/menaquinone biosynthesis C-methylase UbiE
MSYEKEKQQIIDHYNIVTKYYRLFWHGGKSNALHFGLYDKEHTSRTAALLHINKILADAINIESNDLVLDAGCGIGGSSIWLAKERGCNVIGINIVPLHIQTAKKLAEKNGVSGKATFLEADYMDSRLPASKFDVVWAQDSVCHAPDKEAFIKESYRVLKPKGRIVICDGFLTKPTDELKKEIPEKEHMKLQQFEDGFGYLKMIPIGEFIEIMRKAGYVDVVFNDRTAAAMPNFEKIYYRSKIIYPILLFFSKIGVFASDVPFLARTAYLHKEGAEKGAGCYGFITARKW